MSKKRLTRFLFILLLVPLFTGLAQARLINGLDCSQCTAMLEAKPSCCEQVTALDASLHCTENKSAADTSSDNSCPHDELCQTDDSMTVALVNVSVFKELGDQPRPAPDLRFPALTFIVKDQKTPLPPSSFHEERYLMLCSLLI